MGEQRSLETVGEHVATLVHISDLHLFVDENGALRPATTLFARAALAAQKLVHGLEVHDPYALTALESALADIVTWHDEADVPVLVVQSGDVDAYGVDPVPSSSGSRIHRGWNYVRDRLHPDSRVPDDRWHDVFGNHDLWPGVFPGFAPVRPLAVAEIAARPEFASGLPDVSLHQLASGRALVIIRVSSVATSRGWNLLAKGQFESVPSRSRSVVFDELRAILDRLDEEYPDSIRVVVTHHPPHAFSSGPVSLRTNHGLTNSGPFAAVVDRRVHVIAAGHRHKVHPAPGSFVGSQPPLGSKPVQVVAGTATQSPADGGAGWQGGAYFNSFSEYRLHVDQLRDRLVVVRQLHNYRTPHFRADRPEPVAEVAL